MKTTISWENESDDLLLFDPKTDTAISLEAKELAPFQYQLLQNHLFQEELTYGTVIEVREKPTQEGEWVLERIVRPSPYDLKIYTLPKEHSENLLQKLGDWLSARDCYWEVFFHGLLYVNSPKDHTLDVASEIKRLVKKEFGC